MKPADFFNSVVFVQGKGDRDAEYKYSKSGIGSALTDGYIAKREMDAWVYCGSIEQVTKQGVRVFTYWMGKRVSAFLFFRDLIHEPAKDLAKS